MGTVFKKQTTRPLPVGVDIFTKSGQRFARWKTGKRTRTAKLTTGRDGAERIVTESPTWLAMYRDGSGYVCEVSTGCRDEAAARSVLGELERRAEIVRSGIISTTEGMMTVHQHTLLSQHQAAWSIVCERLGITPEFLDQFGDCIALRLTVARLGDNTPTAETVRERLAEFGELADGLTTAESIASGWLGMFDRMAG